MPGDPDNNAQDLSSLLGKMLRIDINSGTPYSIPSGNPYIDNAEAADEIWASGLRNPWRFSFDRETGDLWIADVGQNSIEEIDFIPSGSGAGLNLVKKHITPVTVQLKVNIGSLCTSIITARITGVR